MEKQLSLGDKTGLEGLCGHPHALDLPGRQFHTDALDIRLEYALGLLHELETDTAALLALTFVNDAAAFDWALAGDGANAGHGCLKVSVSFKGGGK